MNEWPVLGMILKFIQIVVMEHLAYLSKVLDLQIEEMMPLCLESCTVSSNFDLKVVTFCNLNVSSETNERLSERFCLNPSVAMTTIGYHSIVFQVFIVKAVADFKPGLAFFISKLSKVVTCLMS